MININIEEMHIICGAAKLGNWYWQPVKENTPPDLPRRDARRVRGCFVCCILPDSQHMLHEQAHGSDADPAAEAQSERFSAGFDELYDVCI